MGSSLFSSIVALCALSLVAGCKPAPKSVFEPYGRVQGAVDTTSPNCAARYNAFLDYAKARSRNQPGYEALQAAEPSNDLPDASTVWAKVAVYPVDGEDRIYVFTQPGHPAHPAVLIKSTFVNSEGMHQQVNGCAWGDHKAYVRFLTAAQISAAWFQEEIRGNPMPGADIPPSQRDPAEVRVAGPAELVMKVAERAWLMNRAGQPPSTIYVWTAKDALMSAAHFTWLEPPSPSADRYALMDAAIVDFTTDEGAEALASWCGGPDASRTPRLCERAKARTAQWALIKSM